MYQPVNRGGEYPHLHNEAPRMPQPTETKGTLQAILTDIQFWIPTLVLLAGILLLVLLH